MIAMENAATPRRGLAKSPDVKSAMVPGEAARPLPVLLLTCPWVPGAWKQAGALGKTTLSEI